MTAHAELYRDSLSLFTDLYQLTMAAGYCDAGRADDRAVFHLFFRRSPFGGGYAVAAGMAAIVEFLEHWRFAAADLGYLASLTDSVGAALFEPSFLARLEGLRFRGDIDAVAEGEVVFAHEPLLRVQGSLLECQLLETALLNIVNFQTLIATKANRIARAAGGDAVLEFGLRRAQGIDGGISASRAAYLGGCAATSNVLAGRLHGVPVRGTHAHSWVMAFDSELEAFRAFAKSMPGACVLLIDTYDTVQGARNAAIVGQELRAAGSELAGVRLDSGDLAALSIEVRAILDEAGLPDVFIAASNDLDEARIARLKRAGARIDVWGVGTRLSTAYDQPALGGVYKLAAIRHGDEAWRPCIKLAENPIKTSIPGPLQVRRFVGTSGELLGDTIFAAGGGCHARDSVGILDGTRVRRPEAVKERDLLQPLMRGGVPSDGLGSLREARERCLASVRTLPREVARLTEPTQYSVGLDPELAKLRNRLIAEAEDES